ncbi:MAG: riboflavin synthase [Microbacter sp.]
MFSGIIEEAGEVVGLQYDKTNLNISLRCSFTNELKIDQSVAHNGVCLTVIDIKGDVYTVTAVQETLDKSNLGLLQIGSKVNLERSMMLNERLDGHIVQGHVDQTAICTDVQLAQGSWYYSFSYKTTSQMKAQGYLTVEKGSIVVNGVSLTVVHSKPNSFSIAIIPYTYEHTNFNQITVGSVVNLEFDIIGKYVSRLLSERQK